MTGLTFVLPLPENLANARMHHMVKHRKRVEYFAACDNRQLTGLIPPPPARPFQRAQIYGVAYVARKMDVGNLFHRCEKWPCDFLKTRGYIVDDSPDHLEWLGIPEQFPARGDPRLVLTLTPIK